MLTIFNDPRADIGRIGAFSPKRPRRLSVGFFCDSGRINAVYGQDGALFGRPVSFGEGEAGLRGPAERERHVLAVPAAPPHPAA